MSSIIIRAQPIVVITRSDRSYCQEDWVEIYNVFPAGREILLGRYCGDAFPGPVESEPGTIGLKVFDHFFFPFVFLACPAIGANAATLSLDFLRLSCTRTKKASLTASRPGTCSTRTSRSIEVRERERAQFPWRRNKLAPRATPRFLPSFLPSRPSITTLDRVEVFAFFFSFSLLFCADCGSNLSVPGAASGVFTSPKWPDKYDRSSGLLSCSWQVQSARDHRILLHFESFSIEGEQESEFCFFFFFFGLVLLHLLTLTARGCAAAAVRVWKRLDEPPVEICGEKLKEEHETFMSEGNAMKVT